MATRPPKVVHITEGFDGGVVTFLRHVLPAQHARGLNVSLVCSPRHEQYQRPDLDQLAREGVKVQVIRMGRGLQPWRDLSAMTRLVQFLRRERFSIVHTHCFKAGVLGRLAARVVPGAAVVHTPHCWPFLRCRRREMGWGLRLVERALVPWTDSLAVVSESQRQAAVNANIRGHCAVIPNALPGHATCTAGSAESLRGELQISPGAPIVGTLSRLVPYKCIDHLVYAAVQVRRLVPTAVFVIAGDGSERHRLEELARRLGMQKAFRFLGHRPDATRILSAMDVFVLCSRAEGMPYTLLESAQVGVPRIASAVAGNVDVIAHEQDGLLYDWGDIDQLARAVVRCLQDPPLTRRLVEEARRRIHSPENQLDQQVNELLGLYWRILADAAPLTQQAPLAIQCASAVGRDRCPS